jgi:hypothetical protein
MHNLNDLLARVERFGNFCPDGAFTHSRNEAFDHAVVDIRFEQGQANFTHGYIHIGLGKFPTPAQIIKNLVETISQIFKHSEKIVACLAVVVNGF